MVECRLRDPPQAENPVEQDSFLRKLFRKESLVFLAKEQIPVQEADNDDTAEDIADGGRDQIVEDKGSDILALCSDAVCRCGHHTCGNVEHVCNTVLEAAENECGDRRVYGENFAGNVGCAHAHPDSYADHNVTQDTAEKDL